MRFLQIYIFLLEKKTEIYQINKLNMYICKWVVFLIQNNIILLYFNLKRENL